MKLFPDRRQWKSWSLTGKLTAIGAYAGVASLVVGALALPFSGARERPSVSSVDQTASARLHLELMLRIGGFQVRVANLGPGPAKQVTVTLKTWQVGAPGPDVMREFPIRDLPPNDDYTLDVELVYSGTDAEYRTSRRKSPTCGYVVVRSIDTARPRAWAFFVPPAEALWDVAFQGSLWPMLEFEYPTNKPESSPCVDYPAGVCRRYGRDDYVWAPQDGESQK